MLHLPESAASRLIEGLVLSLPSTAIHSTRDSPWAAGGMFVRRVVGVRNLQVFSGDENNHMRIVEASVLVNSPTPQSVCSSVREAFLDIDQHVAQSSVALTTRPAPSRAVLGREIAAHDGSASIWILGRFGLVPVNRSCRSPLRRWPLRKLG